MAETVNIAKFLLEFLTKDTQKSEKEIKKVADASRDLADAQNAVSSTAQKVEKEIRELSKRELNIKRIAQAFKEASDAGNNTAQASEKAARALDRIGASDTEIAKVRKELGFTEAQVKKLDSALEAVSANEFFSFSQQRFGLLGDAETPIRAIGGAAGAFGGAGIEGAAGKAGEVFAFLEAVPLLKASLKGLPTTIKAVADELGGTGVGMVGAMGALAVALAIASKEQQKLTAGLQKRLDTELDVTAFLESATQDEINARLAEAESRRKSLDAQKEYIEGLEDGTDKFLELITKMAPQLKIVDQAGLLDDAFGLFIDSGVANLGAELPGVGDLIAEQQALYTESKIASEGLTELKDNLNATAREIELLEEAGGDTTEATRKLSEIESALAKQRQELFDITLRGLDFEKQVFALGNAGDLLGLSELSKDLSEQGSQLRADRERYSRILKDFNNTEIITKDDAAAFIANYTEPIDQVIAQLAVEDITKVTGKITDLNNSIDQTSLNTAILNEELQRLNSPLEVAGRQANALNKIASNSDKTTEDVLSVAAAISELDESAVSLGESAILAAKANIGLAAKYQDDISNIQSKGADKIADIRQNLVAKEAELLKGLNQSIADARTKAGQALEDLELKQSANLLKIERDYARERADIIDKANKDISRAIGDRDVLGFTDARAARDEQLGDAKTAYNEQRMELQRSYQEQLREIQIGLTRQEKELRTRYSRQLSDARQAAKQSINTERQRINSELAARRAGYNAMLRAEQSFVQSSVAMMQNLATTAAGITSQLMASVSQAQQIAGTGVNSAINSLNGGMSSPNSYFNYGGSTTNSVNQNNNFYGSNVGQVADEVISRLLPALGA